MRAVLLSVLILLSATTSAAPDLSPRAAYQEACRLSRYTCKGIRQPMVRQSIFVDKAGVLGMYFGGRTVWLRSMLSAEEQYVVMVHEMVHYLQVMEDEKGFPHSAPFETCLREEEAYEVSDKVLKRLGVKSLDPRLDLLRAKCA